MSLARKAAFPLIIVAALLWLALDTLGGDSNDHKVKMTFSEALVRAREHPETIQSVMFHPSAQEVEFDYANGQTVKVAYPVDESAFELQQLLEKNNVLFDSKRTSPSPWWNILTSLLPFVLLFGFWIFLSQRVRGHVPGQTRDMSQLS